MLIVIKQHIVEIFWVEEHYLEDHPRTCKWLGSPPFISGLGHLEGEQPYLGDLLIVVISHFLAGMTLQVPDP